MVGTNTAARSDELGAMDVRFTACKTAGQSGTVWTLDSDPTLRLALSETTSVGIITDGFTLAGTIKITGAGATARCQFDINRLLTFTGLGNPKMATLHSVGSICGVPIDKTVTGTAYR